eukprot:14919540-Ditylum_brightwellii.AAC.1
MGHPQPSTIVITDNLKADVINNSNAKWHRTKALNMRFYWIRNRIKQGHCLVMWQPGIKI